MLGARLFHYEMKRIVPAAPNPGNFRSGTDAKHAPFSNLAGVNDGTNGLVTCYTMRGEDLSIVPGWRQGMARLDPAQEEEKCQQKSILR